VARDLGTCVIRLQATPPFPPAFDYPSVVGTLLGRLLGSGLFAPGLLDPWDGGAPAGA
jgi:hypothetical protein